MDATDNEVHGALKKMVDKLFPKGNGSPPVVDVPDMGRGLRSPVRSLPDPENGSGRFAKPQALNEFPAVPGPWH